MSAPRLTRAYGVMSPTSAFSPLEVPRRPVGPRDVRLEILFCGICHSDLHTTRNEWGGTSYPCVPGHEIVGRVAQVGSDVRDFSTGDIAAVGCLVDSCGKCAACGEDEEQHCEAGPTFTYNSPETRIGGFTFGGYSEDIVLDAGFVFRLPENLDPAAAAPLLCAGATTYSPLLRAGVGPGSRVGVVGLGGLGHLAVKFASAFGAKVTVFTTSEAKRADALRLGAHDVVLSVRPEELAAKAGSLDLVLDCVSAPHDLAPYLAVLRRRGTLVLVGAPGGPLSVSPFSLIEGGRRIEGSLIAGRAQTREMLRFCGEHGIVSDIELITPDKLDEAFGLLLSGGAKRRFVLDLRGMRRS